MSSQSSMKRRSARASRAPVLRAADAPRLAWRMTRTRSGKESRKVSCKAASLRSVSSSVEPSSTMTTSKSRKVCRASEAKRPSRKRPPLKHGTTMLTAGALLTGTMVVAEVMVSMAIPFGTPARRRRRGAISIRRTPANIVLIGSRAVAAERARRPAQAGAIAVIIAPWSANLAAARCRRKLILAALNPQIRPSMRKKCRQWSVSTTMPSTASPTKVA